jgi:hypothetical protein
MLNLFVLYQRKEKIWSGSCCEQMYVSESVHNVKDE